MFGENGGLTSRLLNDLCRKLIQRKYVAKVTYCVFNGSIEGVERYNSLGGVVPRFCVYCMESHCLVMGQNVGAKTKSYTPIHNFFYMYLFLKMRGDLAFGFTCVSPEVGLFCSWGEVMQLCPRSTVILLV